MSMTNDEFAAYRPGPHEDLSHLDHDQLMTLRAWGRLTADQESRYLGGITAGPILPGELANVPNTGDVGTTHLGGGAGGMTVGDRQFSGLPTEREGRIQALKAELERLEAEQKAEESGESWSPAKASQEAAAEETASPFTGVRESEEAPEGSDSDTEESTPDLAGMRKQDLEKELAFRNSQRPKDDQLPTGGTAEEIRQRLQADDEDPDGYSYER